MLEDATPNLQPRVRCALVTARLVHYAPLAAILAIALGLRLLVWRWHAQYPLGGDEREYFEQALTLLRDHRYVELRLMRPPLYTAFLAACIYLFDSLVQRLRLLQALISALTVVPVYALAGQLFKDRRVALAAALLAAVNYTLAAHATELLTETLFLFGLTTLFWLLLKAAAAAKRREVPPAAHASALGRQPPTAEQRPATDDRRPAASRGSSTEAEASSREESPFSIRDPRSMVTGDRRSAAGWAALAGLALGALTLLRSVALPLLPLGALWLLFRPRFSIRCSLFFVLCSLLVILPWTTRNYLTYGAPILVDTTGAENLWLDNDPAGREAVKRQLYALGNDRAMRQRIALERGVAAIAVAPRRFLAKAWDETQRFFALQYFDDMRERRAIWVPPLEVWLRLLLGDGLWLALLLGGAAGLWLAPTDNGQRTGDDERCSTIARRSSIAGDPRWTFVPWALYTLLTAVVFHVELRYRLPLYPVLLPYAAWVLVQAGRGGTRLLASLAPGLVGAVLTCLLLVGFTLLHRPYVSEAWMLAWKHARLWQAERALARGDGAAAQAAARAALGWDGESALARVALARAALLGGDQAAARAALDAAIAVLPAHPYAHLLRGALLRQQGQPDAARPELTYETASLEDLQRWAWQAFAPLAPPPALLDVGGGLDLGYVRGFAAPEAGGFRWSSATAELMLAAPGGPARLELRLASGRPPGAPPPTVIVLLDGRELGRIQPAQDWRTYSLPMTAPPGPVVLRLRSTTFRPRDYDRASPDNRALGVMVDQVQVVATIASR
jgi:4-amino-4-deoxy-L-arabinose transferase-like glycosyltransferase